MKFILLSEFKELYDTESALLTVDGHRHFLKALDSESASVFIRERQLTEEDFKRFRKDLEDPKSILFHSWVSQNEPLKILLDKGEISKKFTDSHGHLGHQMANEYRRFISPYLADSLIRLAGTTDYNLVLNAMSFVVLLDNDHRATVEGQLLNPIREEIKALKPISKSFEEEQLLIDKVTPLCSDEIIGTLNYLSKATYYLKIEYVDKMLEVIRFKACSTRLANWILKRLELLKLNNEHRDKIVALKNELKTGELTVRSAAKGTIPIRWKTILTISFVLVMGGLIFVLIYMKPFSSIPDGTVNNNTSFKQFTKEERIKIDSLLREMKGNKREEDLYYDPGVPIIGSGTTLSIRTPFKNLLMESIYSDLNRDARLQEAGYVDSCKTAESFTRLKGVNNLLNKKGDLKGMIRNESDFDIIIYVAENKKQGDVHSMMLKKGETKVFEISLYNTLIVVPGNNFNAYSAPSSVSSDELPSDKFKHHFCKTDVNYVESINTAYRLENIGQGKAKFLVTGDLGGYFHLVDIHSVLEEI